MSFNIAYATAETETSSSERERDGYTATQYPIVLVHGLIGFDRMLLGLISYWGGLDRTLQEDGAEVFVAQTSALNSSEVRGEILLQQIEDYLAQTGHSKVNLWGHSQGALDIRYVATVRPELVASITSISGPHGDQLKDVFTSSNDTFGGLITATARLVHLLSGNTQTIDAAAGFNMFSSAGIDEFQQKYPIGLPAKACEEGPAMETLDGNDIYIFSWSGTAVFTNFLDPSDYLMLYTASQYPNNVKTDGIVSRCDSHLGDVIRDDYGLNHFDQVNQIIGLLPLFRENPKSIFRSHANRLKNMGL